MERALDGWGNALVGRSEKCILAKQKMPENLPALCVF